MKNPFSIVFGKNPDSMINSRIELEEIIDDLRNGKKVLLSLCLLVYVVWAKPCP